MALSVTVTYFDTAMILIDMAGVRLLTDPVLDPAGATFEDGPILLRKTSAPSVTSVALGRIDAVLLSHDQHADNLDDAGRRLLVGVGRIFTTPLAASRLAGTAARGLSPWESGLVPSGADGSAVRVTAVPAQHGPDGTQDATGPVTGFVLEHPDADRPLYISGDTIRFPGTEEIARRYAPVGLAILHVGRVRLAPMGDLPFSLSANEAVDYARELQARHILPIHFEGWEHFTEGRQAARRVFDEAGLADGTAWPEAGTATTITV